MKAAVCTAYGGPDVVEVREIADPEPRADEVLVRIHASTVASGDARVRGSRFPPGFGLPARLMFGLLRPRQPILGTDLAGIIEAVGAGVTRFRPGDAVIAMAGARFGCHAELRTVPEAGAIAPLPAGVSLEEAAALPFGGTTALHFLRDVARVRAGERVLVNGASGAVGSAAVQLARHFGAHVTGVCSAANAPLVRSLGADAVIDYRTTDFTQSGERWDIVLDTIGNAPFARSRPAIGDGGRLLIIAAGLGELIGASLRSRRDGVLVAGGSAPERGADLALLASLWASGDFKPVIEQRYPLGRIAKAHARVDTGRKVGNVVVTMTGDAVG